MYDCPIQEGMVANRLLGEKPIRFGYKVWCSHTRDDYSVDFGAYQGKNPQSNNGYETQFGKAAALLVQITDRLPEEIQDLPLRFYFDNLFAGVNLVTRPKSRGYGEMGTFRENCVRNGCPLSSCADMKKKMWNIRVPTGQRRRRSYHAMG